MCRKEIFNKDVIDYGLWCIHRFNGWIQYAKYEKVNVLCCFYVLATQQNKNKTLVLLNTGRRT